MSDTIKNERKYKAINELALRRGFFWQSYEIYGGVSGFVTYGNLGSKLKQNIEKKIREIFVNKLGILEIEAPIITPSKVFEASEHLENFKEPMIECLECKKKFRIDKLLQEFTKIKPEEAEKLSLEELTREIKKNQICCPECGGSFGKSKYFLTMFETKIGPYSEAIGYGRPEAAQGIFVEFKRLHEIARGKLPFGALQLGHALRNEISPRQGLIRLREFTIVDLEFFFDPEEPKCFLLKDYEKEKLRIVLVENKLKNLDDPIEFTLKETLKKGYIKTEWQAFFMILAQKLLIALGIPIKKQRVIEKYPWERAHYALQSFDHEVYVEKWGWIEVFGHAYRTDYDLKRHMKASGEDMRVFKKYDKPIKTKEVVIKPMMSKLGPTFKDESKNVKELISKADPKKAEKDIKKNGYFMIGKYKILPEHIEVKNQIMVQNGKRFIPHVVEPSFGSDRLFYIVLDNSYTVKNGRKILTFPRDIAPIQIGIYPLVTKNELEKKALEVYKMLLNEGLTVEYDDSGSIGRRYARADEIGIPLGVTIDYKSLEDNTVTIRDRDSWKQLRSSIDGLTLNLKKYFNWKIEFNNLGKLIN